MKLAYGGQEIGNLKQLEAGTGTTIEAGKINVALPVRSVTAAEYAALPEAEKQADVLYAVPESGYLPAGDERTVPTGAVLSFLALAPPRGYLACDGAVHNVAEDPRLAAYIQAQFGAKNYFGGDGEATFAVPDLRNLFLRGYHGEAEEQLSGEIGQRQEGTVVTIPHIFGGTVVGMPLKKYEEMQADEVRNAIGYRGYYSASVDQSEPNPMYIVPRPVNMAVLYCIKT